jgi:hypothetical protein
VKTFEVEAEVKVIRRFNVSANSPEEAELIVEQYVEDGVEDEASDVIEREVGWLETVPLEDE